MADNGVDTSIRLTIDDVRNDSSFNFVKLGNKVIKPIAGSGSVGSESDSMSNSVGAGIGS